MKEVSIGTKLNDNINFISISDVHLGHKKVTADIIRTNLKKILYPHLNDELDILFIVGDWFDSLLDMNSSAGYQTASCINDILELCELHKILVRVLRGTYSHDRGQNQFFLLNENTVFIDNDEMVKVFDSIAIEHIEKFDIDILYVPDDLPYEDATPYIQQIINDHQISKVDIALVHSFFKHLLPKGMPHIPHNTFDAQVFSDMVRGVVLNGHVHKTCVYLKIITNGSTDRLNHGESGSKGFYKCSYNKKDEHCDYEFIINKYATCFTDIRLTGFLTAFEGVEAFTRILNEILDMDISTSENKHIRVICEDVVIQHAIFDFVSNNYKQVKISFKKANTNDIQETEVITHTADLPIITEQNLAPMTSEFIRNKFNVEFLSEDIMEILYEPT